MMYSLNHIKMNVIKAMKCCLIVALLLISSSAMGQKLSTQVHPKTVKIGEPFTLTLDVKELYDGSISFDPQQQALNAYSVEETSNIKNATISVELIEEFKDSLYSKGKSHYWQGVYHCIVWDTGKIQIPAIPIIINDSTYYFNNIYVQVKGSDIGVKDELFDIQEGFVDVPEPLTLWTFLKRYWYFIVGGILILIVLIRYLTKGKKEVAKPQKVTSLKDRTLFALDSLEKQRLWENDLLKKHYSELSHILRSYLSSRYEINLLERTTFETKQLLDKTPLSRETIAGLMQILSHADMVKFAQSKTDELTIMKDVVFAQQLVVETSPLEIEVTSP